MNTPPVEAARYALFDALRERRSRRFGLGMTMPAGPLAFESRYQPVPLTEEEEGALAWAAAGITGPALADLSYGRGQGGNIMGGLVARTIASGDCLQTSALVVINDSGSWFLRRPRDLDAGTIRTVTKLGNEGAFGEVYRRLRVRLTEGRVHPPVEPIFTISCNHWSQHAAGSSYFLPVGDLTPMYINGLLEVLNEETGLFILDERAGFRPAGLGRFAASRGGHLDDNPAHGKVATVRQVEQLVTDFVVAEQGMMLQNLGLMTQTLGLGGFPHFANHEFGWCAALGFQMQPIPAGRYLGAPWWLRAAMRLTGRDSDVPLGIGLERDGVPLLRALHPPHYPTMKEAVHAVLEMKTGPKGVLRDALGVNPWKEPAAVLGGIAPISERAVAATVAYCEYLWERYGRFPSQVPPFRCSLAHQVMHVDREFYDRHYQPEALTDRQRQDFAGVSLKRRT